MTTTQTRPRSSRLWPIAAIFITLILVAGFLTYHFFSTLSHAPAEIARGLGAAFRPHVDYQTQITSTIKELQTKPKLVVLTATIDAEVKKSSSTTALWIYWGTTVVDMRARDNRVQFYVPVSSVGTSSFTYDETHKTLTLRVPPPVLDEDVIDVQSNPDKIEIATSNGWAKMDHFSGAALREEAQRELRAAVLQAAKQPAHLDLLQLKAEAEAKKHLRTLLTPLTQSLNPETKLEIEFTK